MNPLLRWAKFNLVGVAGMAVQLSALALFNRILRGHYLLASAAALELTLLHNFIWHLHYTWRDRRRSTSWPRQLLRFHLSNGLVSLVGNLLLMRVLVHGTHLPVIAANAIAIVACSLANFLLSHRWAFAAASPRKSASLRRTTISALLLLLAASSHAASQSTPLPLPPESTAPQLTSSPDSTFSDVWPAYAGLFCGVGASTSPVATKPTVGCGVGFSFFPPLPLFAEVGVLAPQANRSNLSGYVSVDTSIPLARTSSRHFPLVIVGYSRLFETGHALDYGLALVLPRAQGHESDLSRVRIELRDYWTFANPTQHNVVLRLGWVTRVTD